MIEYHLYQKICICVILKFKNYIMNVNMCCIISSLSKDNLVLSNISCKFLLLNLTIISICLYSKTKSNMVLETVHSSLEIIDSSTSPIFTLSPVDLEEANDTRVRFQIEI